MEKYQTLTRYLDKLNQTTYGKEIKGKKNDNDGTQYVSFVDYDAIVYQFQSDLYQLLRLDAELSGLNYLSFLEKKGIEVTLEGLQSAAVESMDGKTILAVLSAMYKIEKEKPATILYCFNNNLVQQWLKRLKQVDC